MIRYLLEKMFYTKMLLKSMYGISIPKARVCMVASFGTYYVRESAWCRA